MKPWEELVLRSFDGQLTDEEAAELQRYLADAQTRSSCEKWLRLEAALRAQRTRFDFRAPTLARLRSELAGRAPAPHVREHILNRLRIWPNQGIRPAGTSIPFRRWASTVPALTLLALAALLPFALRVSQKAPESKQPSPSSVSFAKPDGWAIKSDPHWPSASTFRAWYFEPRLGGPALATSADGEVWEMPRRLRGLRADTSEFAVLFEPGRPKPYRLYYLAAGAYCTEIRVAESSNGLDFTENHATIRSLNYGARGLAVACLPSDPLSYRLFYEDALSGRIVYACSPDGEQFDGVDFVTVDESAAVAGLRPLSISRSLRGQWRLWVSNPTGDLGVLTSTNGLEWRVSPPESPAHLVRTPVVPPPLSPTSGTWDFFSPMDDWRNEGWLLFTTSGNTPDGEMTGVLQNADGTVCVRDRRPWGNFYLAHDTSWSVPFTVELRVRLDDATGTALDTECPKFTVAAMMRNPAVPGPQAWQPAFGADRLGAWDLRPGPSVPVNNRAYQIFTIVCRFDPSVEQRLREGATDPQTLQALCIFDVYVNRNFSTPAFSYHNTGFPGWGSVDADGRLDIGFPWPSSGQLTLDWVRWGSGVILDGAEPREPLPYQYTRRPSRFHDVLGWQVSDSPNGPWSDATPLTLASAASPFGLARFYRYTPTQDSLPVHPR